MKDIKKVKITDRASLIDGAASHMGHVYAESLLRGLKKEEKVKLFVDTGSTFSIVPYELAERLGAHKTPWKEKVSLADGSVKEFEVASIYLEILGRGTVAKVLLSEVEEPALGIETLETLGLRVDPVTGKIKPSRSWKARAPSRV